MEEDFSYQDFDLLIEPGPPGSYRARVLRSPVGESAAVQFSLPFTPLELENFVLKVGLVRRGTRGPGRPEGAPLKDFGGKLYSAIFQGELREVLAGSLNQTRADGAGVRLRLRLTDAPELAAVPWEFLYDPRHNRFLVQSRRTPLVRYLELPDAPHPLPVTGPLRLLVMISSPSGYQQLDVEHEWNVLTAALARQLEEGRVAIERLAANMSTLQERLRREAFHVFHFVGHGFYRPEWADGVLVMEDRNGQPHEVPGEELGGLLSDYDPTRLAVLNACEGARSGASDPFSGVAQSLIQQGLAAVVAMQFEITDAAAILFAHGLYGAIADGYPLEAAMTEARRAILHEGNPTEWGTPVLYSRAPDGRLFDVNVRQPTPHPEPGQAMKDRESSGGANGQRAAETAGQSHTKTSQRPSAGSASHIAQTRTIQVDRSNWRESTINWDGSRLLSIAHPLNAYRKSDWKIQIWDTQTGALLQELQTTGTSVQGAALSPDGTRLAAGSDDHKVRIWDAITGQQQLTLPLDLIAGRLATITSASHVSVVTFSPDGNELATCLDKVARIWDVNTGQEKLKLVHGLPGLMAAVIADDGVTAAVFSRDGTRLATGCEDKNARIWNVTTGQQQLRVSHKGRVNCVAFSPDGTRLATGSDNTARIWDVSTGHRQLGLSHDHAVGAVVFSPDGTRLATLVTGTVLIWDATTGQQLSEISCAGYPKFSSDGGRLVDLSGNTMHVQDIFGG